jgi:hypothetical protein
MRSTTSRVIFTLCLLTLIASPATAAVIASTSNFVGSGGFDGSGRSQGNPISASTEFESIYFGFSAIDQVTTATHELLHAIGFSDAYTNWNNHVGILNPGNLPVYSSNGQVSGILLVLESDFSHADPSATGAAPFPPTGYNQANDIMQPFIQSGAGDTISSQDELALNTSFAWNTRGLNVQLVNLDPLDINGQALTDINTAITNLETAFNGSNPAPVTPDFVWTVTAPEPASIAGIGISMLLLIRRRA